MSVQEAFTVPAAKVEALLRKKKIRLTQGGEPTYVPVKPDGLEWSVTAVGPTKLTYAYKLADLLAVEVWPGCATFYSPGKYYPGETNPRWVLNLLQRQDGQPLLRLPVADKHEDAAIALTAVAVFRRELARRLGLDEAIWIKGAEFEQKICTTWILPLDHEESGWLSANWGMKTMRLLPAEGPAGLRLPLNDVPPDFSRRALTVEWLDGTIYVFFPPLLQRPFIQLLEICNELFTSQRFSKVRLQGYMPDDELDYWSKLGIASDPGVLEVNIPACETWADYAEWLAALERCTKKCGLRSYKIFDHQQGGTGGGNHICVGGPDLKRNAFFLHPGWVTSILRFWQHHPSLSYLFTGMYVGSSSQAPRTDESARSLYDLEMAYQYLESLPHGDHRQIINETLRHLHIDGSGNTHRSEVSFDKFWNVSFPGGSRGLLEFRAVETLPTAEWMSAVGFLWRALLAVLSAHPFHQPLRDFGSQLHDRYFLPAWLWQDLGEVLEFLTSHGIDVPPEIFQAIWSWRFPVLLETKIGEAQITVRKALESWPLLCEQPLEGGSTSRFVDTSIERIEIVSSEPITVRVQGRRLTLGDFPSRLLGAGLRYRKTALYPSLHPGIAPQLPLQLTFDTARIKQAFVLVEGANAFTAGSRAAALLATDCRKSHPDLLTYDLRL